MSTLDLDFIEIGTSNFDTLIEVANDTIKGISVEPVKHYLDQLPNKQNVIKINAAISLDNTSGVIDVFYVPESVIINQNLPGWLKGCNSINSYHPQHIKLKIEKYVERKTVPLITISQLFLDYSISSVNHLKIDTEGGDCKILKFLFEFLIDKNQIVFPKKITFETNNLSSKKEIKEIINLYCSIGYEATLISNTNSILELK